MKLLLALCLLLAAALPAAADSAIGAWRPVAEVEPLSVEFVTRHDADFIGTAGGRGRIEWRYVPVKVHCGSEYEVTLRATGWVPGVSGNSLPVDDLDVTVVIEGPGGTRRERVTTNRDGEARLRLYAPDEPARQTLSLEVDTAVWYAEPPRHVGSYVYRFDWDVERFSPPSRKARAAYRDEVILCGRAMQEGVNEDGNAYRWSVTLPDRRVAALEFISSWNTRFTWDGTTNDGDIRVTRLPDGYTRFAIRGRIPGREEVRVEPVPAERGIRFTVPLCDPAWVEFIDENDPPGMAVGYTLRPAGSSVTRPDGNGDWHVDLGSYEVGKLCDPPREMATEARLLLPGSAPAAGVQARYAVTQGQVSMVGTAGPQADTAGLIRSFDGRIPAWWRIEAPGENLITVTSPGANNRVIFHLRGIPPPWATTEDSGSISMTLEATADPNPVPLRETSRSKVTGTFRFANAPANADISLRVTVEGARLDAPSQARVGDIERNRMEQRDNAILRPDANGNFHFFLTRSEPGTAQVRIYAWTGRWTTTMRELRFPVEFVSRLQDPSVTVGPGGFGLDFGGGLRIGVPMPSGSEGGSTATGGESSGSSTGGAVCPACGSNPCRCSD